MHRIDFTPVFRSTVGFDRMARLVDAAFQASEGSNTQSYPPYIMSILLSSLRISSTAALSAAILSFLPLSLDAPKAAFSQARIKLFSNLDSIKFKSLQFL